MMGVGCWFHSGIGLDLAVDLCLWRWLAVDYCNSVVFVFFLLLFQADKIVEIKYFCLVGYTRGTTTAFAIIYLFPIFRITSKK